MYSKRCPSALAAAAADTSARHSDPHASTDQRKSAFDSSREGGGRHFHLADRHLLCPRQFVLLLGKVGRMKYLEALYSALATSQQWRPLARQWFDRYKIGYHPIARQVVENVLRRHGA